MIRITAVGSEERSAGVGLVCGVHGLGWVGVTGVGCVCVGVCVFDPGLCGSGAICWNV